MSQDITCEHGIALRAAAEQLGNRSEAMLDDFGGALVSGQFDRLDDIQDMENLVHDLAEEDLARLRACRLCVMGILRSGVTPETMRAECPNQNSGA